jgi:hypothetical protein
LNRLHFKILAIAIVIAAWKTEPLGVGNLPLPHPRGLHGKKMVALFTRLVIHLDALWGIDSLFSSLSEIDCQRGTKRV